MPRSRNEARQALDKPERRKRPNGIGRHRHGMPLEEAGKRKPSPARKHAQHHPNEGELSEFNADVEGKERQWDVARRHPNGRERASKPEPVKKPE